MMGQQPRMESLFYYFRLEDQIPEDHLLRLIDRYVDFRFVRERLKGFYSPTGRPSIDPEVLLRLLLVGYLYGITSERRLMEEVRMHLAYRWFTRLDFSQEIPDHSTFSKNRHGRFGNRVCFARRSCGAACRRAWSRDGTYYSQPWMGPWWEPTPASKAASRGSSWPRSPRSRARCSST